MTKAHFFYALFAASLASSFFLGAIGPVLSGLVVVLVVAEQALEAFSMHQQSKNQIQVHDAVAKLEAELTKRLDEHNEKLTRLLNRSAGIQR